MKHLFLSIILAIQCLSFKASGQNVLPEPESRSSAVWGATNPIFLNSDNSYYSGGGSDPQKIEAAKKTRESLPAKDFPEGNWGDLVDGVQVSLRFDKLSYTNGEPINAIVLVRNTAGHDFSFEYSNKVGLGVINYLAYAKSGQPIASKPKYDGLITLSGTSVLINSGFQRKFVEHLNDTFALTNGNYMVQASIISYRAGQTNSLAPYEIKSAKVPIEVK